MKLKRDVYLIFSAIILITILGCQSPAGLVEDKDILFQYSTLGALLEGVYDGEMKYDELKKQGDFGLGTFNALDGEMIELDHQVYQIKSDGIAYPVDDEMKTPFAVVTFFEPDQTLRIDDPMDCDQLKKYLDSRLPTENIPYALKIDGAFSYIKTRSVPSQDQPYPPLLEVLEDQHTFEFQEINGVMVGFRLPDYMEGANAPGYHFHFITADRDAGGHVLECKPQDIKVEIDYTSEWTTLLPEDDAFYNVDLAGEDN